MIEIEVAVAAVESEFSVSVHQPKIALLSDERESVFSPFKQFGDAGKLLAITGEVDGECREFIVEVNATNNQVRAITISCQITFEDLSLSQCPEYFFEDDPQWRVAQISLEALEDFKIKKFKLWEHQLKEPECEAAFRRLLQQGPIRNVFDKFIFPSSDAVALKFKVIDEHNGKAVDVPHQVSKMRLWNCEKGQYEDFNCSLSGAPTSESEAETYWNGMIDEMRELRGSEYIDSLLGK